MLKQPLTRLFMSWLLVLAGGVPALAEDTPAEWPQWRGPSRDGMVASDTWPDRIGGDALQQLWRVELGPSYSGPIVGQGKVYTTETLDKKFEVVRAFDLTTGKQVWEAKWEGSMSVPFFAATNGSWIRSTPALDDGRLFVAGMRDVLVCLNAEDGKEIWRVDFVEQLKTPLPAFGFVSSPLVSGESLYVQAGASLVKLQKRTGQIVWQSLKDEGGMWGSAFSSPYLAEVAGRNQLLVQTREKLAGVDPEDGRVLWSQDIEAFRGMNILTPTVHESAVFTSSYGGRSQLIRLTESGGDWQTEKAWDNRLQGYMSTPLVIDGHAYLHMRNQRAACIRLSDGEITWISQPYGAYWSLVGQGQRILALDERGELLLIQANPQEFQVLDSRKIADSPTWAHLAVVGDRIVIRELNALAVYRWSKQP
ncbi:MAG: PQQ-binding-like beta-propeller repeat protein [Pirellulaceae bacterium]|nr:PQQ-binding-like beta-propeller repeat protein [Pirellulaceae bacterium]